MTTVLRGKSSGKDLGPTTEHDVIIIDDPTVGLTTAELVEAGSVHIETQGLPVRSTLNGRILNTIGVTETGLTHPKNHFVAIIDKITVMRRNE